MDANLALGLFGAFSTIIGAVCFALYLRDRRRVEIRYEFINDVLIGKEVKPLPDGITIQYYGQPLSNLRKSNLIVWNRSTQSIRSSELSRPFTIIFPSDTKMFSTDVKKQSDNENKVIVSCRELTSIVLSFAYLSVSQGFNVEFLYSCDQDSPRLSATLIEALEGVINNKDARPKTFFRRHITIYNMISVTLGMVSVLLWKRKTEGSVPYVIMIVSAIPSVIAVLLGLQFRHNIEVKPLPAHLLSSS